MSVDYRAKLILGYKITEEQYNYIEEHYDIVQEVRANIFARLTLGVLWSIVISLVFNSQVSIQSMMNMWNLPMHPLLTQML